MKKERIVITVGVGILLSLLVAIALGLASRPETKLAKESAVPTKEPEPIMLIDNTKIYRVCIDDRLFILTKSTSTSSEATLTQVFSAYGAAADCWEKKGVQ